MLHLREWDGGRELVLCLHGVRGHGGRFSALADRGAFRGARALAPDLRGHGRSTWLPPFTLDQHLDDLVDRLLRIEPAHVTVVGHSFGGRLAVELAQRVPWIDGLVLLDPVLEIGAEDAFQRARLEHLRTWPDRTAAIDSRLTEGTSRTPRGLVERDARSHLRVLDDRRVTWRYAPAAVRAAWLEMARPRPPMPSVPTALVVPDVGALCTPDHVDRARDELGPLLEVREVPGGHMVLWDAPDEVAAIVSDHRERVLAHVR